MQASGIHCVKCGVPADESLSIGAVNCIKCGEILPFDEGKGFKSPSLLAIILMTAGAAGIAAAFFVNVIPIQRAFWIIGFNLILGGVIQFFWERD